MSGHSSRLASWAEDEAAVQTSFDIGSLRCFASPFEEKSYYFLPKKPDLVRDSNGQPLLTLIDVGASGYLVLAARWEASASNVEELRHEVASRTLEPDAALIRLSFAPVLSTQCRLLSGDGSGVFHPLATNTTSGMPPYDAVFNLVLQHEHLAQAKAGLSGERGFLGIEYLADLQSPVTANATFHALTQDLLPWLRSHSTESREMPSLLDQAVELGLATVRIEVPDDHAGRLTSELYDRVLAQAAQMLPRWIEQSGTGDIHVSATIEQTLSEPIRAFADVGAIVSEESVRSVSGGHDAAN